MLEHTPRAHSTSTLHEHTPAHCEGRPTHSRKSHSHRRNLTSSHYAYNTNTLPYNIHPQAAIDRASTRRNPVGPTGGVRAPSRGTGAYAILVVCYYIILVYIQSMFSVQVSLN